MIYTLLCASHISHRIYDYSHETVKQYYCSLIQRLSTLQWLSLTCLYINCQEYQVMRSSIVLCITTICSKNPYEILKPTEVANTSGVQNKLHVLHIHNHVRQITKLKKVKKCREQVLTASKNITQRRISVHAKYSG